jgi:hypothetical protein
MGNGEGQLGAPIAGHSQVLPYSQYHTEHKWRLDEGERDRRDLWKAINSMKAWVVVGSGSMILTLIGILAQFIIISGRGTP